MTLHTFAQAPWQDFTTHIIISRTSKYTLGFSMCTSLVISILIIALSCALILCAHIYRPGRNQDALEVHGSLHARVMSQQAFTMSQGTTFHATLHHFRLAPHRLRRCISRCKTRPVHDSAAWTRRTDFSLLSSRQSRMWEREDGFSDTGQDESQRVVHPARYWNSYSFSRHSQRRGKRGDG